MIKKLLLCILTIGILTSCEKELTYLYEVKLDTEFTIPSGLNTLETYYFTIHDVPTLFKFNADLHKVDTASITDVKAAYGLLRPSFNDTDLSFVEQVVVNVYTIDITNKKEMYYLEFVPLSTKKELKLLSSTTQLVKMMKSEVVKIEVGIKLRQYNVGNLKTKLELGYVVF